MRYALLFVNGTEPQFNAVYYIYLSNVLAIRIRNAAVCDGRTGDKL